MSLSPAKAPNPNNNLGVPATARWLPLRRHRQGRKFPRSRKILPGRPATRKDFPDGGFCLVGWRMAPEAGKPRPFGSRPPIMFRWHVFCWNQWQKAAERRPSNEAAKIWLHLTIAWRKLAVTWARGPRRVWPMAAARLFSAPGSVCLLSGADSRTPFSWPVSKLRHGRAA